MTIILNDTRIPIWLDCDPGHDDALAIILACFHPSLNLVGISTVHGNTSLKNTTSNALTLLSILDKAVQVPVFSGATHPLIKEENLVTTADYIHGKSGLDGSDLFLKIKHDIHNLTSPKSDNINDTLFNLNQTIDLYQDKLVLIATGPLTNLALLFQMYPQSINKINKISIMGGSIGFGNKTPFAEFNFWCDPLATAKIFNNSQIHDKILLAPLNITHTLLVTKDVLKNILKPQNSPISSGSSSSSSSSNFRKMIYDLLTFFAKTNEAEQNWFDGPPLHDPLAIALVLNFFQKDNVSVKDPSSLNNYNLNVNFNCCKVRSISHGLQKGMIQILQDNIPHGNGVMIAESLNIDAFWKILYDVIDLADNVSPANIL
ncbi:trifunctional uridine nucleosidase/nicotinamide riboside hydrolase/nicotinic acid riboside hydrolase [Ascoidea rubescens DSM 1968]|uniref:Inosine/uridine-preferring nucleoside hydrolase n=1 Tax=Ascoidea rubescens DSM 1968 TaxID=1344418 RepID=A0A1D2VNV8_9ASCO|nr:Inosine/uridine-preferring nucleoside hydrolase [Ascoidea rubescens DSM 1968]ODV63288.1 Inosine/uridine-preferring nucleoside hydrolase [Ascoidea rubescens DSM 1968]